MTDEYIRRQDMVDAINANADDLEQNGGIPYAQGARAMAIVAEQISPADVAPVVHGRWIPYRCDMYECSVCGHIHTSFDKEECDADYCPHCGAKMDEEKKNE